MNEWGMVRTLGGPAQAEVLAVGRRGRGEGRPFSRALGLGPGRQMLSIAPPSPIWGFQLHLEDKRGILVQWVHRSC